MSKKKVLVIGGTGIAGQFITDYLLHYHDICELFSRPLECAFTPNNQHINI